MSLCHQAGSKSWIHWLRMGVQIDYLVSRLPGSSSSSRRNCQRSAATRAAFPGPEPAW
jgi:hypothetical protein